jgi:hypothetical protein
MSANENWDRKETCAKCVDGEIEPRQCEYYGEPNGCNSPTYGEHPNVGNSAKMRETIEWLKERLTAAVYDGSFEVHEALDKIDAALSAPARNCDKMPDIDNLTMHDLANSPCKSTLAYASREELLALVRWLLAPAAERKG